MSSAVLLLGGLLSMVITGFVGSGPAYADRMEPKPKGAEGVEIVERLGDTIPLTAGFRDHNGRKVTLADYCNGTLPVILTMNYSDCPMLCSLQLDGLVEAMSEMKLELGVDYLAVTVSIDPDESRVDARKWMQKYMKAYNRPGVTGGWSFLYGKQESIDRVAEAVGFGYRYLPKVDEYSHAAVTMIVTPDGRLSRYLYGVQYDPTTLRLSLVESSDGKIGTPMDRFLLLCFRYDPEAGSYAAFARNLMKAGGVLIVLVISVFLFVMFRRERRVEHQNVSSDEFPLVLEGGRSS